MKKRLMLPLVAAISTVMVGCGGGGGDSGGSSGPAPIVYQWQVVDLYSIERSKVSSGCAIFANDDSVDGNVIAARVADRNFRILFHDENGQVVTEKTIDNIPTNGLVSIKKDDIPYKGYVALEELSGLVSGQRESYIFGVQKDLMHSMTIAVRNEQPSGNACYRGGLALEENANDDAVIAVSPDSSGATKFQTSASGAKVLEGSTLIDLPVVSGFPALERKIVTGFNPTGSKLNSLTHYAIIESADVYDKQTPPTSKPIREMTSSDVVQYPFTNTNITLNEASKVKVVLDNDVYGWQPINSDTNDFSYVASEKRLSNWTAEVYGKTTYDWNYVGLLPLSASPATIVAPTVTDFTGTSISNCDSGYCVTSTSYSVNDFAIQRTAIRSKTDQNKNFYQSIYGPVTSSQVVLESPTEQVSPTTASDTIEIGLVAVDESNVSFAYSAQYLMKNSIDMQDHVGNGSAAYSDFNGRVVLEADSLTEDINMMKSELTFLTNRNN
ncbi:hypothetical protein ACE1OE_20890 [Vibrio sp. E150_011]